MMRKIDKSKFEMRNHAKQLEINKLVKIITENKSFKENTKCLIFKWNEETFKMK